MKNVTGARGLDARGDALEIKAVFVQGKMRAAPAPVGRKQRRPGDGVWDWVSVLKLKTIIIVKYKLSAESRRK